MVAGQKRDQFAEGPPGLGETVNKQHWRPNRARRNVVQACTVDRRGFVPDAAAGRAIVFHRGSWLLYHVLNPYWSCTKTTRLSYSRQLNNQVVEMSFSLRLRYVSKWCRSRAAASRRVPVHGRG